MINNRQAGRRRGRGGNGNGNGQRPGGNPGRPDNGNRIDNRARGNANQLYEKYKNLASDAQRQGDRVNTEYYLQFADHYFRVLNENRSRFEEQGQGQRRQRDDNYVNGFDNEFDGDDEYGDEGEPIRAGDQGQPQGEPRRAEQGGGQRRDGGERNAGERNVGDRSGGDRSGGERNADRGGFDRQRDRRERRDEGRAEPVAAEVEAPRAVPSPAPAEVANDLDAAEAPVEVRRRGRPRRERAAVEAEPVAIDAERLPPALSAGNDTANDRGNDRGEGPADRAGEADAEQPKPRRRRARPAQDEAPAA